MNVSLEQMLLFLFAAFLVYHFFLKRDLKAICKASKISIISCNCTPEAPDAIAIKKSLPVHVIFTYHCVTAPKNKYLRNIDTLTIVNHDIVKTLEGKNQIDKS